MKLEEKKGGEEVVIEVAKAEGGKCERCWNYSASVGKSGTHPLLCHRCVEVLG